jgi:hypothetical protein
MQPPHTSQLFPHLCSHSFSCIYVREFHHQCHVCGSEFITLRNVVDYFICQWQTVIDTRSVEKVERKTVNHFHLLSVSLIVFVIQTFTCSTKAETFICSYLFTFFHTHCVEWDEKRFPFISTVKLQQVQRDVVYICVYAFLSICCHLSLYVC